MSRFDLFIFDMDGVLVETSLCHQRAYEDLWKLTGIQGPEYPLIAGRRTAEVIAEYIKNLDASENQIAEWTLYKQQKAREYLREELVPYADALPCLQALALQQCSVALATGSSRETTMLILEQLDALDYFSIVVTAEDVTGGKPSSESYTKVLKQTGISSENCLIIEDSKAGLEAAADSQAYVACVRSGNRIEYSRFIGNFPDLTALMMTIGICFST